MTTNEEIAKKEGLIKPSEHEYKYYWEKVNNLMDLARADERDSIKTLISLTGGKEEAYKRGFDKGCLETKEKIRKMIERKFKKAFREEDENDYIDVNKLYNDVLKELSCPETPKQECLHLNKECDENGCFKDEGEKE